jgi:hypothetical protein
MKLNAILIWYAAGTIAAIAVGWVAAVFHLSGHAPVGIISVGVGLALGAALGGAAVLAHVRCRTRLIIGTLVLAMVTVLAEHAWLYVDFRRQWQESRAKSAEVAMFRSEFPLSPIEFFAYELSPERAALWGLDAVLIAGAAVGAVIVVATRLSKTGVASDAAE